MTYFYSNTKAFVDDSKRNWTLSQSALTVKYYENVGLMEVLRGVMRIRHGNIDNIDNIFHRCAVVGINVSMQSKISIRRRGKL